MSKDSVAPKRKVRRAAIYLRVSTKEQTTENQERELRRWAEGLGVQVASVYRDTRTGSRADRAGLRAVLAAGHAREYDVLLIWSLDRLTREGIGAMLRYLETLRAMHVRVLSLTESWVDTSSPVWDLLVAVFAWVAQQERQRIGDRVRAGQARARAQGVHLGRKPRVVDIEELCRRRAAGQGWRRIARAMRTPTSTLRRRFRECQKSPSELRHPGPRRVQHFGGAEGLTVR